MKRLCYFTYGLIAYCVFFGTILYLIGFVGNFFVPKSIDSGHEGPVGPSIALNLLLIGLFAIQHTIMARPAFKRRWKRIVPEPLERSTFVLFASAILVLLFWQWKPVTAIVWHIENSAAQVTLIGTSLLGWGLLFFSSFLIDHFDLFGLRQVYLYLRGKSYVQPRFVERSLYKVIRHPLMTGVLLGIWATPTMTVGHFVFALGLTAYIALGVIFEERDLLKAHGDSYERYRRRTRKFLPIPRVPKISAPVSQLSESPKT